VQNQPNHPIRFEWPFLMHARRDSKEPNTVSQNLPKEAKILFFSKEAEKKAIFHA
jgi:hypothetical protein